MCRLNYPDHMEGVFCKEAEKHAHNQGAASDFIEREQNALFAKRTLAEKVAHEMSVSV